MKLQNNEENRDKLAYEIVEAWDLDTLMSFALEKLQEIWKSSEETFIEDWKCMNEGEYETDGKDDG